MKNIGDCHDHYLKKVVLLLTDVFEKFTVESLKFYKLDPSYYFSSSGLSWDAMLKMTSVKLELSSDIGKYLFIEEGLRGGISYICKRFSEANNKHMKKYDPTKECKLIIYLDTNNLYGWAISQCLSYGKFRWLKNIDNFDVNMIEENIPIGYIPEVDLEYPNELHKLHNNYALGQKQLAIPYGMLSRYCKNIANKYGIKVCNVKKLVPNLGSKTDYVLQYRNLQLHLSL